MTVETSEHCDGKNSDENGGKRAVDADRNEAAAALFGGGNGDGAGRTVSFRHAAKLRYARTDTPDDPASRPTSCCLPKAGNADIPAASAARS